MPLVSVIVLSHRWRSHPEMVQACLDSVRAQTLREMQVCVQFAEHNWPTKLNEMVEASVGDYFVILCDDDQLAPAFLTTCLRGAACTDADIVYTDRYVFTNEQHPTEGFHFKIHGEEFQGQDGFMMRMNPELQHFGSSLPMTFLCKRSWWNRMGGFDPEMPHAETEFWYRSVAGLNPEQRAARTLYVPKPLFYYRDHDAMYSRERDQSTDFLRAFHRKHFARTGVMADQLLAFGENDVGALVLNPKERADLLATGWTPPW
jgi:hypothetical protein